MQCAGRWQVFHGSINGGFLGLGQDQGFELWALKSRIWDLGSGIWDLGFGFGFGFWDFRICGFADFSILVWALGFGLWALGCGLRAADSLELSVER
jgi:hypothetical protein